MERLLEHSPLYRRKLHNTHKRLMERHEKHIGELRADILLTLNKDIPRTANMKMRQQRIEQITDDLVRVLIGHDSQF